MPPELRIAKIGGSLLDRPRMRPRVAAWVHDQPCPMLLLAGGGRRVDRLRRECVNGGLTDADAHWQAIRAMDTNTERLAADLGVECVPLTTEATTAGVQCILVRAFLHESEPSLPGQRLPIGWEVTSDSIAARIAELLDGRLVLLKSSPPPKGNISADRLAESGYVDAWFPRASVGLRGVSLESLQE